MSSVKDRISKMNSFIIEETAKAQEPEKPLRSRSSDISLRFKSRGSETSIKSRSSDLSLKSPLQLPGMETEKGGECGTEGMGAEGMVGRGEREGKVRGWF